MIHRIREELKDVLAFVGVTWCVFFLGLVAPFNLDSFGVTPRTLVGLVGIPAVPFLHANLAHLLGNTIPLIVLLLLLAGSRAKYWAIVVSIVLLGGVLLWCFGRQGTHVGASGLIYGLAGFLIISGFLEKRIVPLVIAVTVGFLYGGTLLWGIVPRLGSHVSWDGHFYGAIAGGITAYLLTKGSGKPRRTRQK